MVAKPVITQELTDSANRMKDAVNLHVTAYDLGLHARQIIWVAINLSDGRSDGVAYDSRDAAVEHTDNLPGTYFYVKVGVDSMGLREAILVLQQHRQAFRAGVRFRSEHITTTHRPELLVNQIPNTLRALGFVKSR
jgi:hypothetical protein